MDSHTSLLLGSAGEGVVREDLLHRIAPRAKCSDVPRVGQALSEALNDVVSLTSFFSKRHIDVAETLYAQGVVRFTKVQVIGAIQQFFRQPGKKFFWLMYAGHGEKDKGNWSCYDGFVTLGDILDEWRSSGNAYSSDSKLFIFSDCCFSGVWKNELRDNMPSVTNVAIQASCKSSGVAYDGIFTKVFIHYQEEGYLPRCSCEKPGSSFCFLREQCPGQHVAWQRHLRYKRSGMYFNNDNDIRATFGIELISWGIWNDW